MPPEQETAETKKKKKPTLVPKKPKRLKKEARKEAKRQARAEAQGPPEPEPTCKHGITKHSRGSGSCLWCEPCKRGLLSCVHAAQLITAFFENPSKPAGCTYDRVFVLDLLDGWDQRMTPLLDVGAGDEPAPDKRLAWADTLRALVRQKDEEHGDHYSVTAADCLAAMNAKRAVLVGRAGGGPRPGSSASAAARPAKPAAPASNPPREPSPALPEDPCVFRAQERSPSPPKTGTQPPPPAPSALSPKATASPSPPRTETRAPPLQTKGLPSPIAVPSRQPSIRSPPAVDDRTPAGPGSRGGAPAPAPKRKRSPASPSQSARSKRRAAPAASPSTAWSYIDRDELPDAGSASESSADSLMQKPPSSLNATVARASRESLQVLFAELCDKEPRLVQQFLLQDALRSHGVVRDWVKQRLAELERPPVRSPRVRTSRAPPAGSSDGASLDRRFEPPASSAASLARGSCAAAAGAGMACAEYHEKHSPWPADRHGACTYHAGKLIYAQSFGPDPRNWDEITEADKRILRVRPGFFVWTCCRGDGAAAACAVGFHVAAPEQAGSVQAPATPVSGGRLAAMQPTVEDASESEARWPGDQLPVDGPGDDDGDSTHKAREVTEPTPPPSAGLRATGAPAAAGRESSGPESDLALSEVEDISDGSVDSDLLWRPRGPPSNSSSGGVPLIRKSASRTPAPAADPPPSTSPVRPAPEDRAMQEDQQEPRSLQSPTHARSTEAPAPATGPRPSTSPVEPAPKDHAMQEDQPEPGSLQSPTQARSTEAPAPTTADLPPGTSSIKSARKDYDEELFQQQCRIQMNQRIARCREMEARAADPPPTTSPVEPAAKDRAMQEHQPEARGLQSPTQAHSTEVPAPVTSPPPSTAPIEPAPKAHSVEDYKQESQRLQSPTQARSTEAAAAPTTADPLPKLSPIRALHLNRVLEDYQLHMRALESREQARLKEAASKTADPAPSTPPAADTIVVLDVPEVHEVLDSDEEAERRLHESHERSKARQNNRKAASAASSPSAAGARKKGR